MNSEDVNEPPEHRACRQRTENEDDYLWWRMLNDHVPVPQAAS